MLKQLFWAKLTVGIAVAAGAAGAMALTLSEQQADQSSTPSTAPSQVITPAADAKTATVQAAWEDLLKEEPHASSALLRMASQPDATVALLREQLAPATLTMDELLELLAALESEDEAVWRPAAERMQYYDPRLAMGLEELMDMVEKNPARSRLVHILSGRNSYQLTYENIELRKYGEGDDVSFNFYDSDARSSWWAEHRIERINDQHLTTNAHWLRAVRAIVLLEHIGTPEARAVVDGLATGHPDAQPTRAAKDAIAARMQPAKP